MGVDIIGSTASLYHDPSEILQIHKKKKVANGGKEKSGDNKTIKFFKTSPKWWTKSSIKYAFSHPHVRSRLEKLMGSNLVSLTDRDYMQKLQERILEDYAESMDKRIKTREHEEMERVKSLVLSGKIPICEAPESMAEHPIMLIEAYCNKLIAERRTKIKVNKVRIPTHLYLDDTPDPPSGLSIENGHVFRAASERLCNPPRRFITERDMEEQIRLEAEREVRMLTEGMLQEELVEEEQLPEDEEDSEQNKMDLKAKQAKEEMEKETLDESLMDEEMEEREPEYGEDDEYMFTKDEFNHLRYESPLIKELKLCETVQGLYELADEIIGVLKTVDGGTSVGADTASVGAASQRTAISQKTATSQRTAVSQKTAASQKAVE